MIYSHVYIPTSAQCTIILPARRKERKCPNIFYFRETTAATPAGALAANMKRKEEMFYHISKEE